jgi:type IV pilus assembly protein PilB
MAIFRSKQDEPAAAEPLTGAPTGTRLAEPPSEELTRVGSVLVERQLLTTAQLGNVLRSAGSSTLQFVAAVQKSGVATHVLLEIIGQVMNIAVAKTSQLTPNVELTEQIPAELRRANKAVIVARNGNTLVVVTAEPLPTARAAIASALQNQPIEWLLTDPDTASGLLARSVKDDFDIDRLVKSFETTNEQRQILSAQREIGEGTGGDAAPVVQVVNRIVAQAMRDRASDVHIEPMDDRVRVRFRIDGTLVEIFSLPAGIQSSLVSRLKILADMNIVERRRPQDGQFSLTVDGKDLDVRMSTLPMVFGEKVVLRLLDKSRSMIGLSSLGFPRDTYEDFSQMAHSPFGMVLCAGPTGAGKTTTLYATLQEINSTGKNVTTIEDPVEYVFPGINQIQTNDQAGLTFASGLRAILRQDPDVVLVGEIRDVETARIGIQAALTGHLVLSSLHGTDAVAALHRFLDMGIESFLIASSVIGVVSQRLLRRMCQHCKAPYKPSSEEVAFYERNGGYPKSEFFQGAGCEQCAGTGYRDRIGIYELLRITPELRRLIVGWATQDELRKLAVTQGMRTLAMEAISLVDKDVTTIAEVVRTLFGS